MDKGRNNVLVKRVLLITDSLDFAQKLQTYCCIFDGGLGGGYNVTLTYQGYEPKTLSAIFRDEKDGVKNHDGVLFAPLLASSNGLSASIIQDHQAIRAAFCDIPLIVVHDFFRYTSWSVESGNLSVEPGNIVTILREAGADEVIAAPIGLRQLFFATTDGRLSFYRFWRQDSPDMPNSRALTL